MQVAWKDLRVGDVFLSTETNDAPEELEVLEPPMIRSFHTHVDVKSLQDGFVFKVQGHPDDTVDVRKRA